MTITIMSNNDVRFLYKDARWQ